MNTVYKYALAVTDVQKLVMPAPAKLLHVGIQGDTLTLWAWVDANGQRMERQIAVVGTGNPAPPFDEAEFVGSVFMGPFVWHVFDGGWV